LRHIAPTATAATLVCLLSACGGGGGGGGAGGAAAAAPPSNEPIPYKKTKEYAAFGYPDSTDDIRGGVGADGFKALYEFVQQGGTIITEGNTAQNLVELDFTPGVKVEPAQGLFARGTILRGVITDKKSPLVYGYTQTDLPVYFSQAPVFNAGNLAPVTLAGAAAGAGRGAGAAAGRGGSSIVQNTTPMATPLKLSPWDPTGAGTPYGVATSEIVPNPGSPVANADPNAAAAAGRGGRGGGGRGGFGGGGAPQTIPGFTPDPASAARVVMSFPANASDMLLSGTLEGGELLSNRAQLVDESVGKGHIVMFAFRPYWRWQTQGTFAIGFNAIMNWNHLDAGK